MASSIPCEYGSFLKRSNWPKDVISKGNSNLGLSGPISNGNIEVLYTPQIFMNDLVWLGFMAYQPV